MLVRIQDGGCGGQGEELGATRVLVIEQRAFMFDSTLSSMADAGV
jgi:hypothetical protein